MLEFCSWQKPNWCFEDPGCAGRLPAFLLLNVSYSKSCIVRYASGSNASIQKCFKNVNITGRKIPQLSSFVKQLPNVIFNEVDLTQWLNILRRMTRLPQALGTRILFQMQHQNHRCKVRLLDVSNYLKTESYDWPTFNASRIFELPSWNMVDGWKWGGCRGRMFADGSYHNFVIFPLSEKGYFASRNQPKFLYYFRIINRSFSFHNQQKR